MPITKTLRAEPVMLPRGTDKAHRIKAGLQPKLHKGQILFHPQSQGGLMDQIKKHPRGRLKDRIDALNEMAKLAPMPRTVPARKRSAAVFADKLRDAGVPEWDVRTAVARRQDRRRVVAPVERSVTHAPDGRPLDPLEQEVARMRMERRRGL